MVQSTTVCWPRHPGTSTEDATDWHDRTSELHKRGTMPLPLHKNNCFVSDWMLLTWAFLWVFSLRVTAIHYQSLQWALIFFLWLIVHKTRFKVCVQTIGRMCTTKPQYQHPCKAAERDWFNTKYTKKCSSAVRQLTAKNQITRREGSIGWAPWPVVSDS